MARKFVFHSIGEAAAFMRNFQPWHTGKVAYNTEESARRGLAEMREKGRTALQAYQCKTCGKWHLGNPRKQVGGKKPIGRKRLWR